MIHQEAIRIRRPLRPVAATLALFALGCLIATVGRADSVTKKQFPALAIKNVKIVVKPGEVIENGSIVMRDGVFVAVGAGVEIPYDAEVIDGEGLTAYAGFIDASTQVGIPNGDAADRRSG
ncbi:hypothetical protein IIC65_09055, partial [Candidatus Sumerlaeota bacterium]|nr:hypothetical protein [Candidatus Sumerlaeota bacterium]